MEFFQSLLACQLVLSIAGLVQEIILLRSHGCIFPTMPRGHCLATHQNSGFLVLGSFLPFLSQKCRGLIRDVVVGPLLPAF